MTVLFSGGLRPFPGIPEDVSPHRALAMRTVLEDVQEVTGSYPIEIPGSDAEDFWEDAFRMSSALRTARMVGEDIQWVPEKIDWSEEELRHRLGPVSTREEGGHHTLDQKALHEVLVAHAGREITATTLYDDEETDRGDDDLAKWMVSRHKAGVERIVLKNRERKNGIWLIETAATEDECSRNVFGAMGWTAVRLAGARNSLIAQDALDLQWEYRCFVVDGIVHTAAGCIEEFTPLDADPFTHPYDTRVRQYRGHLNGAPSPVEDHPEITEKLLAFAEDVAKEHGGTVVIDVAIDAATGSPVVIELNGLSNSGLYASDPLLVYSTWYGARDHGYRLPTHN